MFMTLLAFLLSLLFTFFSPHQSLIPPTYLFLLLVTGGTLLLLATLLLNLTLMRGLENLEQHLIPNLTKLVREDKALSSGRYLLFSFTLLSYGMALFVSYPLANQKLFFVVWFIFFGIALDLLNDTWKRSLHFLNPSYLVDHLANEGKRSIRNDKDAKLWETLDNLSEIGVRSVEKSKLALANHVTKSFPPIIKLFLEAAKSIGHAPNKEADDKKNGVDEASYGIFYLIQRLELIYDKALKQGLETICREIIIALGKIITYCASYDLSMVTFPTHFLTKFGLRGQQHHFQEVGVLTTSTLLEVAKNVTSDVDLTYQDLQEPFRSIINGLEAIAKQTFKKDKRMQIALLIHPFLDLKGFFETDKMASHRDTPAVIASIDNIISEFQTLQSVMQRIPSLPQDTIEEEKPL